MNSFIAIIGVSIFFVYSGWHLTYLLPSTSRVERTGLSFLFGSGMTTFIWFVGYLLGLPFNLLTLGLSGLILVLLGYLLSKFLKIKPTTTNILLSTKLEKYLLVIAILSLTISFAIGIYHPLTAWDSLAQYDFRGHAIAIDHDLSFIRGGAYFISYPLMISLVHAAVYMLGGISAQGIHSLVLVAFIVIIYGRMTSWTNSKYGILSCLLVIFQSEIFSHSTFAYTNLPYTTFLVAGIMYIVSAGQYSILIGGLLIGLSTWVRASEVFWILGIVLVLWQGIKYKKLTIVALSIFIIMVMRLTWSTYQNYVFDSLNWTTSSTASHFNIESLGKITKEIKSIYWYTYLNIIFPYIGIWFLSFSTTIAAITRRNMRSIMMIASILLSSAMVVAGIMIFSTYYPSWNEIGDSARRMVLFIIPLSLIAAVYSLYLINNKDIK
jgi:hypothetical protein